MRGLLILGVFLVFHYLGFRDYTCVLTGTSPTGDPGDSTAILIGICYTLLFFITITITPILLIGSLLFYLLLQFFPEKKPEEVVS